jgi:hypothetical protein
LYIHSGAQKNGIPKENKRERKGKIVGARPKASNKR